MKDGNELWLLHTWKTLIKRERRERGPGELPGAFCEKEGPSQARECVAGHNNKAISCLNYTISYNKQTSFSFQHKD